MRDKLKRIVKSPDGKTSIPKWKIKKAVKKISNEKKINKITEEVNICYSIILKIQNWIVRHEKEHKEKNNERNP